MSPSLNGSLICEKNEEVYYEIVRSKSVLDEWCVEAVDDEGRIFVIIFSVAAG